MQPTVSLSTAEAEYRAATMAAQECAWLVRFLNKLNQGKNEKVTLYGDNVSSILLAKNPTFHARTKHIEVHYHFIREKALNGEIDFKYVNTLEQAADIFHKKFAKGESSEVLYSLGNEGSKYREGVLNETIYKGDSFLKDHPTFLRNPLYISGISYVGIVVPIITLELYEGNEREDQPTVNIQGYILTSPLTDKFMDFNSRLEYAHRLAFISDNIYQSAIHNCNGNYVDANSSNTACSSALQAYEKCTSRINLEDILEPYCDENDPLQDCESDILKAINNWGNTEIVQQALKIRQGKVGKWVVLNTTLHYHQGKNDTLCYSYDIFSSFSYHKKLSTKTCRALIVSGDHDFTFPYVGVEQWIASLYIKVYVPWQPFYIDGQVGGYETRYAQNDYSLTFATVKGAGHSIQYDKPKESMVLTQEWFSSQTYSTDYLMK